MSKTVTFPGGRTVTFRRKSRKGQRKRAPSAYNRFIGKEIKRRTRAGASPKAAMKAAARAWKAKRA